MKAYQLFYLCLVTAMPAVAEAQSTSWKGTFSGHIEQLTATLVLRQHETRVSGEVDAEGYRYQLVCDAKGTRCSGTVTDLQTAAVLAMVMVHAGKSIAVTVDFVDNFGNPYSATYTFNRQVEPVSKSHGSQESGTNRDANLIGNWLFTDTYVSGDFTMTTQYRLIVNADGTYLYGDAKIAGGGDAGSLNSEGGGYSRGQWKTENSIIYVNDGSGWQPYCRYYIENNSMMMTFDNGKRQVWKRN